MSAPGMAHHGTGARLHAHHVRLDHLFDELLEAYEGGDWDDVRVVWTRFESELRQHMEIEEQFVLPVLARVSEGVAAALRSEHDEIRSLLGSLGVGVDLHMVKDEVAGDLVAKLREHAAREDLLAYRVADREVPEKTLASLDPAGLPLQRAAGDAPNSAPTA